MIADREWETPAANRLGQKPDKSKEAKGRESSSSFALAIKFTLLTRIVVHHREDLCMEENTNKFAW